MKSINLDDAKQGIIVFSKNKEEVKCIYLCKDKEFGGIRTNEECESWCPEYISCKLANKMLKIAESAPYKEVDA